MALIAGVLENYDLPAAAVSAPARHRIVLDAGHGGMDGGATGCSGVLEKDLNLQIARKCELLLVLCGISVTMTRQEDTSLDSGEGATIAARKSEDIRRRVTIANSCGDALVSVHMNSFPDPKYWGTQVFFSLNREESGELAGALQSAARELLSAENRREAKRSDSSIYLLSHAEIPAVIVECGFLSNPEEERRLRDNDYQNAVAAAVCGGILNYFSRAA